MCPACFATAALVAAGATSAGGVAVLVVKNLRAKARTKGMAGSGSPTASQTFKFGSEGDKP